MNIKPNQISFIIMKCWAMHEIQLHGLCIHLKITIVWSNTTNVRPESVLRASGKTSRKNIC